MNYLNYSSFGSEFLDDAIRFADIKDVLVPGSVDLAGHGDLRVLSYPRVDLAGDVVAVSPASNVATADACELLRLEGVLAADATATQGPALPFIACLTGKGDLAIFPSEFPSDDRSVWDGRGLAYPDPASKELAEAVFELNDYVNGRECVPLAHADDEARRLLDRAGFAHWDVDWRPETDDQRCASFVVDREAETIQLVPTASPSNQTTMLPPGRLPNARSKVAVHLTRDSKRPRGARDHWRSGR